LKVYNKHKYMNHLAKLFFEKPYLAWYVKDTKKISKESMLEHILNFGDWGDYLDAEKTLGIKNVREIFINLKSKTRSNLRTKTINYFDKYFQRYA
jgi:hypothetical protein